MRKVEGYRVPLVEITDQLTKDSTRWFWHDGTMFQALDAKPLAFRRLCRIDGGIAASEVKDARASIATEQLTITTAGCTDIRVSELDVRLSK